MKYKQPPLLIDCNGLSKKSVEELADILSMHFCDVIIFGNDIEADNPINGNHYADAWHTIDRFGVKAT